MTQRDRRVVVRPAPSVLSGVQWGSSGARHFARLDALESRSMLRAGANQFLERAAAREEFRAERARQRHGFTEQRRPVDGGDRVMCTSELYI